MRSLAAILAGALLLTAAASVQAQVVREEGAVSIAGILEPGEEAVELTFRGDARDVLFATIDSTIYQSAGRSGDDGGCEESTAAEGGCGEDPGGGCGGEEEPGAPLHLKLELLDEAGVRLCHAGRPTRPGWQRDPRLVCILPSTQVYTLRVVVGGMGEEEEPVVAQERIPFLLDLSLRQAADGGEVKDAVKTSRNKL